MDDEETETNLSHSDDGNPLEEQVVPWSKHGIVSLSDRGFSTKLWGPPHWLTRFSLAANMSDLNTYHPHWIAFLFRQSFGSTGPCHHCCHTDRQLVFRPDLNFDELVLKPCYLNPSLKLADILIQYEILKKNKVNTKLNKHLLDLDFIRFTLLNKTDPDLKHAWEYGFWNWLYIQILMFPLDVSIVARRQHNALAAQYQDYVHFIQQMKHMLPIGTFRKKWIVAYYNNPPTARTFSSRENLFIWAYQIHTFVVTTGTSRSTLRHSIYEMGRTFEALRSSSCTNAKNVCQ
ncbi:MAG: hypothetical protein Sylvanvirus1_1, partial [Sylvanvirus sp.]